MTDPPTRLELVVPLVLLPTGTQGAREAVPHHKSRKDGTMRLAR